MLKAYILGNPHLQVRFDTDEFCKSAILKITCIADPGAVTLIPFMLVSPLAKAVRLKAMQLKTRFEYSKLVEHCYPLLC